MSGALKRNADEILEALEAAATKFRRALGQRQRDQASGIRERTNAVRQRDGELSDRQDALTSGPIHELDIGTYRDLSARARRHSRDDGIEHDHIPSAAALIEARRREVAPRQLTSREIRAIENNAVTIALRNDLHALSRTFRNRNNPEQIALDASDLRAAAERDYQMLRISLTVDGGYTPAQVDAVLATLRELNGLLGR